MRLYKHPIQNAKLYLQAGSKKIYMEFYDENGVRRQISSKTENLDEAKDKLSLRLAIVQLTKSGELKLSDNRKKSVKTVIDEVIQKISKAYKFKGITETKRHLELIKKEIGDLKISNLQTSDLDKIYNQPLSKTKISNFNRAFSLLFEYAKDEKYIENVIAIPKYEPKEETDRKVYHIDEIRKLFAFIQSKARCSKSQKTKLYAELITSFSGFLRRTGLRYGEALAIKHSDIVKKVHNDQEVEIVIRSSKTAPRNISVSNKALVIINDVVAIKKQFNIAVGLNDYVFSGFNNVVPDYSGFLKEFKRRYSEDFEKNGWSDFVLYSLRHEFIRRKIAQGSTVFDVAKHCGTSVSMIEDYYTRKMSMDADKIYHPEDYLEIPEQKK